VGKKATMGGAAPTKKLQRSAMAEDERMWFFLGEERLPARGKQRRGRALEALAWPGREVAWGRKRRGWTAIY
jgi:hypothetical protein